MTVNCHREGVIGWQAAFEVGVTQWQSWVAMWHGSQFSMGAEIKLFDWVLDKDKGNKSRFCTEAFLRAGQILVALGLD